MFEYFFFISLVLGGWLIYEVVADKVHGPGRYWIVLNVEGDADRVEYLIRQLAKDQKIKIRSYNVSVEKPEHAENQKAKKLKAILKTTATTIMQKLKNIKLPKPRQRQINKENQTDLEEIDEEIIIDELELDEIENEKIFLKNDVNEKEGDP